VKCPVRQYGRLAAYRAEKLEGLVVFCTVAAQRKSVVLELLARDDNPETMGALLLRTCWELKTQGTGLVIASFPTNSRMATVLKELGFKFWGTRLWNMSITIAKDPRRQYNPELDLNNWEFSRGDWLDY
jgi:hypothetical protein